MAPKLADMNGALKLHLHLRLTCNAVEDGVLPVGVTDCVGRAAVDHLLNQLLCLCQLEILLSALDRTQLVVPGVLNKRKVK